MTKEIDSTTFAQMQLEKPIASYRKTILGKVDVRQINPWNGEVEEKILEGDPKKNEESCIVDIWNPAHEMFFKRANKFHLELGYLQKFTRPVEVPEKNPNDVTDEEIEELLDGRKTPYLKMKSAIGAMTSPAPLFRVLDKAKELEKSEKMIKSIEARIAEVQTEEYKSA